MSGYQSQQTVSVDRGRWHLLGANKCQLVASLCLAHHPTLSEQMVKKKKKKRAWLTEAGTYFACRAIVQEPGLCLALSGRFADRAVIHTYARILQSAGDRVRLWAEPGLGIGLRLGIRYLSCTPRWGCCEQTAAKCLKTGECQGYGVFRTVARRT